jgi:hypothetical protein
MAPGLDLLARRFGLDAAPASVNENSDSVPGYRLSQSCSFLDGVIARHASGVAREMGRTECASPSMRR